jgi:hypothetical protein
MKHEILFALILLSGGAPHAQESRAEPAPDCALATQRLLSAEAVFTGGKVPGGFKVVRGADPFSVLELQNIIARVTKTPVDAVYPISYGGSLFSDIENATCDSATTNGAGYLTRTRYTDGILWVAVCDVANGEYSGRRMGKLSSPGRVFLTNVTIKNTRYVLAYQWVGALSNAVPLEVAQKWAISLQADIREQFRPRLRDKLDLEHMFCTETAVCPFPPLKKKGETFKWKP